ncbi:hypothetical protein E4U42_003475 [Claviceps africana]|uniref:Cyanovirin-N domain-containing protein n=1 Tax=Claviceps africana TaxID=83212 RepID=A0A8K0J759_9HYPO|nr:hypothetical protein E4U42_003475 [Claviceps africana]
MQLSTSAALAVFTLYAGQALAGCTTRNVNLSHRSLTHDCDSRDGAGTWTCQTNGAKLALFDNTIMINAGYQQSVIEASCAKQPHIYSRISCTPGAWGSISLNCPNHDKIVVGEYILK